MRRLLLVPLIALFLSSSASAQSRNAVEPAEPTMILTGAVYDIQGSVIVNETRVVAYHADGRKYQSATSDEGFYKIELPLAVYKIEVSAPGFCLARVDRFKVVNSTHRKMSLDFVLDVQNSPDGCDGRRPHGIQIVNNPKTKTEK